MIDPSQHRSVVEWADYYRSHGWHALPSAIAGGRKRPIVPYREYWTADPPADLVASHPCEAIQVILGRRAGLIVLDLDGPAAIARYDDAWASRVPPTWQSRSGGGGRHVWLRVARVTNPLRRAVLWTDGERHSAIERLADRSLIVAPPSRGQDREYQWLEGSSPHDLARPAHCPAWILGLPDVVRRVSTFDARGIGERIAQVPAKIALAASWGVRFTGRVSGGWHQCRAIDREDRTPSAQVHETSGWYVDFAGGSKLSLLELAVALGRYSDWAAARDGILGPPNETRRPTPKDRSPRT